jgi:putative two-component system response regulator
MIASRTDTFETWHGNLTRFARMRLLIIDDEQENVDVLQALLEESGYSRVRTVTNSAEACEVCHSFEPDLVLLDLIMPPPDGLEVLQCLRRDNDETFLPVIVLTGDNDPQTKRRLLAAGATDYLVKPFDRLEVVLRIANLLEIRRLNAQLDAQRGAFEDAVRARTAELRQLQAEVQTAA